MKHLLLAVMAALMAGAACAADGPWYVSTDVQGLATGFSGSADRDSMQLAGLFVTADYLERAGFAVGINATTLSFSDGSADTDQRNLYLSGRRSLNPGWLPGTLKLRLDVHAVDNNADASGTDDVRVVAPIISFLNYRQTFYFDVGYARSSYGSSADVAEGLTIRQWTPTLGFAFNDRYDWLQLRAFRMDFSSRNRAQGRSDADAVELKWTHWFAEDGPLGADNFRASVLAGERIYAVDHDAAAVYNLTDRQTGGASLGIEWRAGDRNRVLLLAAAEKYRNGDTGDRYRSASIYLNWHRDWN